MMYINHMRFEWDPEKNERLKVQRDVSIYLVPHLVESNQIFLKTIIPSRKATRDYLKEQDERS